MDEAYIDSILSEYGRGQYPDGFLNDYEALECFAQSETDMTLLVRCKATGERFVAKCYTDKTLLSHITEADILEKLSHPGLPRFADKYENEHMLCVVREYVPGISLDGYAAQSGLGERQAVCLISALCDILFYLHGQTPPIVHRDIKPQNLVIDARGGLHLIDFGISRIYDKEAEEDTVCYGTKHFAAPEQYGFAQTDTRTDIFALGVLLGWLLTGESQLNRIRQKVKNRRLLNVVERCTAFAPEKRYQSVCQVKRALQNVDGRRQRCALRWVCGLLMCSACLCAGFALGRFTDVTPSFMVSNGVTFEEPLIERAVRLALNKGVDEPIEEKELLSVTELYIYGDQVVKDYAAFNELGEHMALNDGVLKNGGLASLSDLAQLKNLKTVCIALEDITNLSPLASLEALETIDLRHNPVKDVVPLSSLPALRNLVLFETRVSELSSLSECTLLTNVNVGKTQIASPAALSTVESIRELYMRDTPLQTLSGIERLNRLQKLELTDVADGNLDPLLALPQLKEVHLGGALRQAAKDTLEGAAASITYSP